MNIINVGIVHQSLKKNNVKNHIFFLSLSLSLSFFPDTNVKIIDYNPSRPFTMFENKRKKC